MRHIAIVYHSADFDGQFSNLVCRHWLAQDPDANVYSQGWNHGEPLDCGYIHNEGYPDARIFGWHDFEVIYVVDIAPPQLLDNPGLRDRIVWIDHHISSIQKYDTEDRDGLRVDGVAACRLAWQFFLRNPKTPDHLAMCARARTLQEPEIVRLIGEYDVWDHRDERAELLQYGLKSEEWCRIQPEITLMLGNTVSDTTKAELLRGFINDGRVCKRYAEHRNKEHARAHMHDVDFCGLKFAALNIGAPGGSAMVQPGANFYKHDALMAYRFDGKVWRVSLYHLKGKEHIDLSVLAAKVPGGGGHRGACGFSMGHEELSNLINNRYHAGYGHGS